MVAFALTAGGGLLDPRTPRCPMPTQRQMVARGMALSAGWRHCGEFTFTRPRPAFGAASDVMPMAPSSSTRPSSSRRGHSAAQSPRCHLPTVPASLSHTSARLRAVEDLCSSFSWTPAQLQSIGFTDHEIRQGRLSCTKVGVLPAVPGKLSPQQLRQHAMRDACSVTYWSALQLQDLGVFSRKDLEEVGFFTPPCFRPLPRPLTAR